MAQSILIGGINAQSVTLANFMHFLFGALSLGKYTTTASSAVFLWTVTGVYALLAGLFGWVTFTYPTTKVLTVH